MNRRIALATCAELPELDAEGPLLIRALGALGLEAVPRVWDDATVQWDDYALVVLRSTWDYPSRRDRFLRWARGLDDRLVNPFDVVRWNTDKRYLEELAAAGLSTVPTRFIAPGEPAPLPAGDFVVKPVVSAGSKDTARYDSDRLEAARRHIAALHAADRWVMVQPYRLAVETEAETAMVFFDGAFSHAARKAPLLRLDQGFEKGLFRPEEIRDAAPTREQRALAEAAVQRVAERFGTPLYARVDMLADDVGNPEILELELVEPSLFLDHAPGSARRFASCIAARLSS